MINIPDPIKQAITNLLKPYGMTFDNVGQSSNTKTGKRYLTVNEAESYLGVSYHTLYRFSKAGKLPVIKLDPESARSKLLYDVKDIDRLMRKLKR